jgi:hypothetical protein
VVWRSERQFGIGRCEPGHWGEELVEEIGVFFWVLWRDGGEGETRW